MTATILPSQRQSNRDSMTVGQGLGLLHDNGFYINGMQAEYLFEQFRVHVVLRQPGHCILHVAFLRPPQDPLFLHISGGITADGVFTPYDVPTVVAQARKFARLIAARKLEVVTR